jgi:hypothetical protein
VTENGCAAFIHPGPVAEKGEGKGKRKRKSKSKKRILAVNTSFVIICSIYG